MSTLPLCDHDECSKLSCRQPVPASGSELEGIVWGFLDGGWSYADVAHLEPDDATKQLIADAILTIAESEDFIKHIQSSVKSKWDSDRGYMNGFAQILKERGLMPSGTELIEAMKRFNAQNSELNQ